MRHWMIFLLMLGAGLAAAQGDLNAQWETWEDFSALHWEPQQWPLTEQSTITWDTTRKQSGERAMQLDIDCVGWGGGVHLVGGPLLEPTGSDMSVWVYCEPLEGAQGMPAAKLELIPAGGGTSMGSDDTALSAGQWTCLVLPAVRITQPAADCGLVFLAGEAKGKFRIWADALRRGETMWEDFEYSAGLRTWKGANINGESQCRVAEAPDGLMPAKVHGRAVRLSWLEDSDGVELKSWLPEPLNASGWSKVRLRVAVGKPLTSARVNLWLFDGERGSLAMGEEVSCDGQWHEVVFDLAAHREALDLAHLTEVGVVVGEYVGPQGLVWVDQLDVQK